MNRLHQYVKEKQKGFTLIELLIVIAIIVILAAVVFVALDPLKRFQDARDARRWSDADAIISALKLYQVDNGGAFPASVAAMTSSTPPGTELYQIGTGLLDCDDSDGLTPTPAALTCGTALAGANVACVDLTALVDAGYLGAIPIAQPNASATTPNTFSAVRTGYTIERTGGNITVRSCKSEGGSEISIKR